MQESQNGRSKRILKNTAFLYLRSIVSLVLKLYTSRVVLEALGVEDFGVYQVVGGLVAMFSFLNSTMAAATQRFLSYEIGIGDIESTRRVFSTTVNIHFVLSVVVFLLVESVGIYLLNHKLDIGNVDNFTAQCVLHFTALSLMLTINSVPYNSLLISRENMSYFAYIDIAGEVMKLLVAISLSLFTADRLIYYAALMFVVSLAIRLAYAIVCHRKYAESHYMFVWDKALVRKITSFSAWTTLSSVSFMIKAQGVTLILNVFLGPILNAATGIANQVNSAIKTFSQNFQMSFMPQIVKTYAIGEFPAMNSLVFSGAKLSTYLLMALAGPVMLEIDYLLELWLVTVPPHTGVIVVLVLIESVLQTITCTGNTAIRATGRVKWYEIAYNGVELLALPAAIAILYYNAQYYVPFVVIIVFTTFSTIVKLGFMKHLVPQFRFSSYLFNVLLRPSIFMAISLILPVVTVQQYVCVGFGRLMACAVIYEIVLVGCIALWGLNVQERDLVKKMIHKKSH